MQTAVGNTWNEMRKSIFVLIIISSCYPSLAQPSLTDKAILERVAENESMNGSFYLECEKQKTYFDKKAFKESVGTTVPEQILTELQQASLDSKGETWESNLFSSDPIGRYLLKTQCLTKTDYDELFQSTGKRQRIVSISDPIFDLRGENCVVTITYRNYKGGASGYSYFLKKVYGRWAIVFTYDHWTT